MNLSSVKKMSVVLPEKYAKNKIMISAVGVSPAMVVVKLAQNMNAQHQVKTDVDGAHESHLQTLNKAKQLLDVYHSFQVFSDSSCVSSCNFPKTIIQRYLRLSPFDQWDRQQFCCWISIFNSHAKLGHLQIIEHPLLIY